MPEQCIFSNTCIFSISHITVFSCLWTLDDSAPPCMEAILNSKKHKNYEKYGTKLTTERICIQDESWNRRQCHLACSQRLGVYMSGNSNILLLCAYLWMTVKFHEYCYLGLQVNFNKSEDLQIWNLWIMKLSL